MDRPKGLSFSSGPPRFLVCVGGRPEGAAARYEQAVEKARILAARGRRPITIYEIATGAHLKFFGNDPRR